MAAHQVPNGILKQWRAARSRCQNALQIFTAAKSLDVKKEAQALLARIDLAQGQPLRKKLLSFVFEDPAAYAWGGEAIVLEGERVGEVSSVGWSPAARTCVALGYIRGAAANRAAESM